MPMLAVPLARSEEWNEFRCRALERLSVVEPKLEAERHSPCYPAFSAIAGAAAAIHLLFCRPVDRERDMERRPLPFGTLHRNPPSMRIHDVLHNLRAESRASDFSADRLVGEKA